MGQVLEHFAFRVERLIEDAKYAFIYDADARRERIVAQIITATIAKHGGAWSPEQHREYAREMANAIMTGAP